MGITKQQIKWVQSLLDSKTREELGLYIVEGIKNAEEWLRAGVAVEAIFALENWYEHYKEACQHVDLRKCHEVLPHELQKISNLVTPNQVLLIVKMPQQDQKIVPGHWYFCLDRIQDPGNLGTIIRIADWFGIEKIFLSHDSVDPYHSKVVQSCMGGLLRVAVSKQDLKSFLAAQSAYPIYGAVLDGRPISTFEGPAPGFILLGNESKGLGEELIALCSDSVSIPKIGQAESLNVAVAAGIIAHVFVGK